jgi:hypothetical protein
MTAVRNRLGRETSPYLLLHAENPVDWYPWGEEAFERARAEDKPIFLSVGYSTCYWCHVMERESFSDAEIARQMNDGFVSIKLDREERPDLDEIYMAATQVLTRSGGWPNSLFLTHDLKPFYAGTYFPPRDAMGRPGFPRLLAALREAWQERRDDVLQQADAIAQAIREHVDSTAPSAALPDASVAEDLQAQLARRFDDRWGGFGSAPKFPSPSNLSFLLERRDDPEARRMLLVTLDRMARGGLQDQIAGGFHRYSTDARWLVPHFEKMLYDNAALAPLFAEASRLDPEAGHERVARRTLDFVLAELTGPSGGFLSAIDAETDGHEGAYYTWTAEELKDVLAGQDHALLASVYGFEGPPSFEQDRYVLHLPQPLPEQAKRLGITTEELLERIEPGRRALLEARSRRKRPLVDDKVLADWNGLMIGAMARTGRLLGEKRYVEAARRGAAFVLDTMRGADGRLLHAYRDGAARIPAFLDDYAFLVQGLLELDEATGEERWRLEALRLLDEQDARLWDESASGYFAAGEDPRLLFRAKPAYDGAVAAGNGIAALNLVELARRLGDGRFRERAERLLKAFGHGIAQMPLAHVSLVQACLRLATAHPEATSGAASGSDRRASVVATPAAGGSAVSSLERAAEDVVHVAGSLRADVPGPWKPFAIELSIVEGWHVNANPASLGLVPTAIHAGDRGLRGVSYPTGERFQPEFSSDALSVYKGRVRLEGEVEVSGDEAPSVVLTYQACDDTRCLPPITKEVLLR